MNVLPLPVGLHLLLPHSAQTGIQCTQTDAGLGLRRFKTSCFSDADAVGVSSCMRRQLQQQVAAANLASADNSNRNGIDRDSRTLACQAIGWQQVENG